MWVWMASSGSLVIGMLQFQLQIFSFFSSDLAVSCRPALLTNISWCHGSIYDPVHCAHHSEACGTSQLCIHNIRLVVFFSAISHSCPLYVCLHECVCICVCIHVTECVCMYAWMNSSRCICFYVCMVMYASAYINKYIYICIKVFS